MDLIKSNPLAVLGLIVAGIGILTNQGNFSTLTQTSSLVQQQRQLDARQRLELQQSQATAQERDAIAKSRYQNGCLIVVAIDSPDNFTSLSQGEPVMDAVRNTPLPDGSIVCDANGNTGEIVGGVVSRMAFTGDKASIEIAMQTANAQYSQPGQE